MIRELDENKKDTLFYIWYISNMLLNNIIFSYYLFEIDQIILGYNINR